MDKVSLEQQKNKDQYKLHLSKLRHRLQQIKLGGGEKKIAKQHKKGKLTVHERIAHLIDPGTYLLEIGALAAYDMYKEYGGCPAAVTCSSKVRV